MNPLMPELLPLLATGVAALGLLLILLPGPVPVRRGGGLVAIGGVVWLMLQAGAMPGDDAVAALARQAAFVVFAAMSLAGAVQMISQQRPVYSALFFVLVVLSTCGVLLLLEAWFMAFSVVIVYAGAILITYMFVLMLAQQASDAVHLGEIPEYDRCAHEPVAGVIVAALMAGGLTLSVFTGIADLPKPADTTDQVNATATLFDHLPRMREAALAKAGVPEGTEVTITVIDDVVHAVGGGHEVIIPTEDLPGSTRQVGWDLVARFPASLEVAGVVLLMAMFGAVVLARRQIDMGEDALRASAGLDVIAPAEDEGAAS